MADNIFKTILNIRKEEWPITIMMSIYFFLVTVSFWVLKPIKKAMFIGYYVALDGFDFLSWHLLGSQGELLAKLMNIFVAAIAVIVFTLLVRRFIRHQLTIIFGIFIILCYFFFAPLLPKVNNYIFSSTTNWEEIHLENPLPTTIQQDFVNNGITLSESAYLATGNGGRVWRMVDEAQQRVYSITKDKKEIKLNIYMTESGKDVLIWTFYLFGDLFISLMIVTFFAFLNNSVPATCACRIYGLIGFGGVAGGAFGSLVLRTFIKSIDTSQWMLILTVLMIVIIVIAVKAGKMVNKTKAVQEPDARDVVASPSSDSQDNPALEGAKLVLSSKYLIAILAIVGLYEMVSTIMDFQFTATVEHFLPVESGPHFALVYTIMNFTALIVQLFLTSFVLTRFGVGIGLLILPFAALAGSAGYLLAPVLVIGSVLPIIDNGFSYSINQSSKEILYIPTSKDVKYKAKAFIDMFFQRFAKGLAIGLTFLMTTFFRDYISWRWLSLISMLILIVWIQSAKHAGKIFSSKNTDICP